MPVYEYQCVQCDHHYDRREGFDAPVEQACPRCGGSARRRFRPPAVVFKGPGFYSTDHRKSSWSSDGDKPAEPSKKEPLKASDK